MRYVHAIPRHHATGLVAQVYDMIEEDFFINGSLTSRSKVPALLAGIWTAGRESVLVDDHLDRTTKEAMNAVLSQVNACPYCGDMLISLVHAGGKHEAASRIYADSEAQVTDITLRERLAWVKSVATPGATTHPPLPFTAEELPEAIAALMAMSDINRFSHVVMDGSPVSAPLGLRCIKAAALRLFGRELRSTHVEPLAPRRALPLLPPASLPVDMQWAAPNPRIADALARWAAVVEREATAVVSPAVRELVARNLYDWKGDRMPIGRHWVDREVSMLTGKDRAMARLTLVLAKAPYQLDETLVEDVLNHDHGEERFIRLLAWASFSGARAFAQRIADAADRAISLNRITPRHANAQETVEADARANVHDAGRSGNAPDREQSPRRRDAATERLAGPWPFWCAPRAAEEASMSHVPEPRVCTPDFAAIKQRQQATWASGDYATIGTRLQIVGESLAEAVDLRADERVLDVAAGNGNATLAAARRFARVTSTDYVPDLLEKGAARARAEGLDIEFQVADAEALPFDDGSFDVVLSTFGAMFAPEPRKAAQELKRVVRRGGRIGMANWTPDGFVGELFRTIAAHMPPPAGLPSPMLWGSEPTIVELFGPEATDMRCVRRQYNFRYRSAAHWIEEFHDFYGPLHKAYLALDSARQLRLTDELMTLLDRRNVGGRSSLVVPGEYLEVVITRT
jgi:ubiquinone/menaquinone biosynthesis C-methylase UbiE